MSTRATLLRPLMPLLFKRALREGVPVPELRRRLDRRGRLVPRPRGVRHEPTTLGGRSALRCRPANREAGRAIIHVHGGAHVMGSFRSHGALAGRLAIACAGETWLPDYPLAPEHPHPAGAEAIAAAYLDLQQRSGGAIAMISDSSGGAVMLAALAILRDAGERLPRLGVLLSPWLDLTVSGASVSANEDAEVFINSDWLRSMAEHYAGDADLAAISPLALDLTGFPPLHVQVSADEVLLSDAERLSERAREDGVECTVDVWSGVWHAWHTNAPLLPEATRAIRDVGRIVVQHTSAGHGG